jgi:hypothetical protein
MSGSAKKDPIAIGCLDNGNKKSSFSKAVRDFKEDFSL